jgi:hypothetical protein
MASFAIQIQLDAPTKQALNSSAASLVMIASAIAAQQSVLAGIEAATAAIAKAVTEPPPPVPVSIRLALPIRSRKGIIMANYELNNDEVDTIPILVDDSAGVPVAPPAGDAFSVVSSIPASLNAVPATTPTGGPAIAINALVAGHLNPAAPAPPDLFITISDSAGLTAFVLPVDIVSDTTPKAITPDLAHVTHVPQPVPTAPGP